jgi:hypothetical protein
MRLPLSIASFEAGEWSPTAYEQSMSLRILTDVNRLSNFSAHRGPRQDFDATEVPTG